jgi:hypothetical protein
MCCALVEYEFYPPSSNLGQKREKKGVGRDEREGLEGDKSHKWQLQLQK